MQIEPKKIAHIYSVARYMIYGMIGLIGLQIIVYVLMPPPETAYELMEIFWYSTFKGLLSLDLLYMINNALLIMIYFAFSLFMMKKKPLLAIIAFVVGIIGIACYYASNPAFEFYFLAQKYALATGAERLYLEYIGEGLLLQYKGTAFISYYIFNAIALYLYAVILLYMKEVPRRVPVFAFMSAILMSIPSSFGLLGLIFALLSLVPWMIFLLMMDKELRMERSRVLQA